MEINVSLDEHGRTRCECRLDYTTKSITTSLNTTTELLLDKLLFDAEIADCALLPRTFWMSACQANNKPRCLLEQMAAQVFQHHVGNNRMYDEKTSGAEWWVQLRPSPPGMGRYAVLEKDNDEETSTGNGITFHWDKDEDLRIAAGGSLHVHPHLSTVTYLTCLGAPTMVFNQRVHNVTGEWVDLQDDNQESQEAFVSWPRLGKHLSFDGRYLHAAPLEIMEDGAFEQQCTVCPQQAAGNDKKRKVLQRRHRRVTFLVNVWLNYKPFNVNPFPDTLLDKLTGVDERLVLFPPVAAETEPAALDVQIKGSRATTCGDKSNEVTTTMAWPLGGCGSNESISARLPLETIRSESQAGGNVNLVWNDKDGVFMSKGTSKEEHTTDKMKDVKMSPTKRALDPDDEPRPEKKACTEQES